MSLQLRLTKEHHLDSRKLNFTLMVHKIQCIKCVPVGARAALEGGGGRRGGAFLVLGGAVGASLVLVAGVDAAGGERCGQIVHTTRNWENTLCQNSKAVCLWIHAASVANLLPRTGQSTRPNITRMLVQQQQQQQQQLLQQPQQLLLSNNRTQQNTT